MIQTEMNGLTPNLAEENAEKVKRIFPEVFHDGKIDFHALRRSVGDYAEEESGRYSFTWHGKIQSLRLSQLPGSGTLLPCPQESKNWSTTQNLYLEGDNLEVLKLLQKAYHGKVKMIYIDPPYNTGNDFVYPDDYRDSLENYLALTGQTDGSGAKMSTNTEASGRFHTNWLNMMYPRLRLARNLLTDDGIIFISIDDNEIDNLKKICNEVFGEENYINLITLKTKACSGASGGGEDKRLKKNNEYIFMYAKMRSEMNLVQPVEKVRISDFIKEHKDNGVGFYYTRILEDFGTKTLVCNCDGMALYRHTNYWFTTVAEKMKTEGLTEDQVYHKYFDRIFMVTNAQTSLLQKANRLIPDDGALISYEYIPKTGRNKGIPTTKYVWNKTLVVWLSDSAVKEGKFVYKQENLGTLWGDISWGRLDLQGEVPFKNGKKPLKLIERFLNMATEKDSIVLDFFSGSATTAHAVLLKNAQDGGARKFIQVQLPEPTGKAGGAESSEFSNICEIGKERIRRAGEKLISELNQAGKSGQAENLDVGFKVLKLAGSNLKKWNPDPVQPEQNLNNLLSGFVSGRTKLDLVYEIMLKYGVPLTEPVEEKTVPGTDCVLYCAAHGALSVCLEDHIPMEAAAEMVRLNREWQPEGGMRAVFYDGGFPDDSARMNTIALLRHGGITEYITL